MNPLPLQVGHTTILVLVFFTNNLYADSPYYIDFQKILNDSTAGKKAQKGEKT